jgi:hypothetical protein
MSWGSQVVKHVGEVSFDSWALRTGTADNADHCVLRAPAITRLELEASIARTKSLRSASPEFLKSLAASTAPMLSALFDNRQDELAVTVDVEAFADAARTGFSGDIGAGFADVLMRRLGFVWHANGHELQLTATAGRVGKRPDFAYWGPCRYHPRGIGCLVEAKGSTSSHDRPSRTSVVPGRIRGLARRAYIQQVAPFLGATSCWHGCSIAFGTSARTRRSYSHVVLRHWSGRPPFDWPGDWWPPSMWPDELLQRDMSDPEGRFRPLRGDGVEVPALFTLLAFRSILSLAGFGRDARRVALAINERFPGSSSSSDGGLPTLFDGRADEPSDDESPDDAAEANIEMGGCTFLRRSSPGNPAAFGIDRRVVEAFFRQFDDQPLRSYFTLPVYGQRLMGEGEGRAVRFSDGLLYAPGR